MRAVMIKDLEPTRRFLAVDLRHVLSALGPRALAADWRVREVWAEGEAESELEALDANKPVSGKQLATLAEGASQIIDGEFSAFESGHKLPWVIVEAVDSTYYAVRASDPLILIQIKSAFHEVVDYEHPDT